MSRQSKINRNTLETQIELEINIDGTGKSNISTGIGFFDHMLTQISRHGFMDLEIKANGDLDVDCHHTVEDVGIVLGKALSEAIGNKEGINRYGQSIIPMEEALILVALDFSGRPLLCFDAEFSNQKIGDLDTEMIEEFFRAICNNCGLNLHIKMLEGKNNHHICEGIFKGFAKALEQALTINPKIKGVLSSKGMLE